MNNTVISTVWAQQIPIPQERTGYATIALLYFKGCLEKQHDTAFNKPYTWLNSQHTHQAVKDSRMSKELTFKASVSNPAPGHLFAFSANRNRKHLKQGLQESLENYRQVRWNRTKLMDEQLKTWFETSVLQHHQPHSQCITYDDNNAVSEKVRNKREIPTCRWWRDQKASRYGSHNSFCHSNDWKRRQKQVP